MIGLIAVLRAMTSLWLAVTLVIAMLPISLAVAQPAAEGVLRVAILPVDFMGTPPAIARERVEGGLIEGLSRGSIETIPAAQVLESAPEADGCASAGCYTSVAEKTSSTHLVRTIVEVGEREYAVTVQLVDGNDGTVVAKSEGSCDICGVAEAAELAADHAASLRTKLEAIPGGPGVIALRSVPEGAVVTVDGEQVGTTPFDASLPPGEHVITLSSEGYSTLERRVNAVAGVRETMSFELQKAPDVKRRTSVIGWVLVGAGVVAAATGGALLGIDEKPHKQSCEGEKDENGVCPFRYNTLGAGIGLVAVGAAAIVTGVVLVVVAKKGRKKKVGKDRVALQPAAGGLRLRF